MATNRNDLFPSEVSDIVLAANKVKIALNENQKAHVESIQRYYDSQVAQGASSRELKKTMDALTSAQKNLAENTSSLESSMLKQQNKRDKAEVQKEAFLGSWFGKIVGAADKVVHTFTNSTFGDTIGLNKAAKSFNEVGQNLQKFAGQIVNQLFNLVDTLNEQLATAALSSNVRLQGINGSGFDFIETEAYIKKALGLSPYVKQTDIYASIEKLANQGIARDIESRAFLDALSKEIASTFDATSAALQRIVRLQQEDSTAQRLGMEAALTQILNSQFQDSSYMNANMSNVTSILVELESQLNSDEALQVEFNIQKWLGALSARGMSDSAINQIAQGMAYLGTGNVSGLMSNDGLQRLFTMAITEQGQDYAEVLLNGLDAQMTDTVMQGVIKVLQKFGTNEFSQVVRSEFADLLGVSLSDFKAALSMGTGELYSLSNIAPMNNNNAMKSLYDGMEYIDNFMHLQTKLDNLWDNFLTQTASGIIENPTKYAVWKINDLINKASGGINVSSLSYDGVSVDQGGANLNEMIKLGLVGGDLLDEAANFIQNLGNENNLWSTYKKLAGGLTPTLGTNIPLQVANNAMFGSGGVIDMISKAFEKTEITEAITKGQARTINEHISDFVGSIDNKLTDIKDTINTWFKSDTKVTNTIKTYYNSLAEDSPQVQAQKTMVDSANAFSAASNIGANALQQQSAKNTMEGTTYAASQIVSGADDATRQDIVNALNNLNDTMRNGQSSGMGGYYE